MNKIKIAFLILLIMFVSGCKYRSSVVLELDGTVTEKVTITDTKENSKLTNDEYSKYLDSEISKNIKLINYGNYSYKEINNKDNYGLEFSKSYDSICSYFGETLFNQYVYKHIKCTESDEFITIENDTPIKTTQNMEDYSDPVDLTDIELSIKLPFSAYENNADVIMGKNEYIWKLGSSVSDDKSIKLVLSKEDMEEAYLQYQEMLRINKIKKIIKIGIFISFTVIGILVLTNSLYKKYKKNKLEY